ANTLQAIDILPGPVGNFPKGTLFGFATNAAGNLGQVYVINPASGFAFNAGAPFAISPSSGYDIDINPNSGLMRIVDSANDNISFSLTTGVASVQTPLTAAADVVGAAYD